MRTLSSTQIVAFLSVLLTIAASSQGGATRTRWHAGTWDSTIYNRAQRPRTVGVRLEIVDSDTMIPVEGVQVRLWGRYWEEWIGRSGDQVGIPLEPQEKEFRLSAATNEDGVVVFALGWQKEYPWRTYFGDHAPREYRKDGGYSTKDSWIRAVDDVEKIQRIEIRHPKYDYKEIQFNFKRLLEFGQDKGSQMQEPRIFDAFEEAWPKEIKRKDVKFCVLNLGTKFKDFQNTKSRRPEFFEKVRKEDWGTVYQRPYNLFSAGGDSQSECGPYFVYLIDEILIEKRTREIEITGLAENESEKPKVTTRRPPIEPNVTEWTCPACGHIYRGDAAPNFCPQCGKAWSKVETISKSDVETTRQPTVVPSSRSGNLPQQAVSDFLGLAVADLKKERAMSLGLSPTIATNFAGTEGMIVEYVTTDSPADRAGLIKNCIIEVMWIDGYEKHLHDDQDYQEALRIIRWKQAKRLRIRYWQFPDKFDGKIDYRKHLRETHVELSNDVVEANRDNAASPSKDKTAIDDSPISGLLDQEAHLLKTELAKLSKLSLPSLEEIKADPARLTQFVEKADSLKNELAITGIRALPMIDPDTGQMTTLDKYVRKLAKDWGVGGSLGEDPVSSLYMMIFDSYFLVDEARIIKLQDGRYVSLTEAIDLQSSNPDSGLDPDGLKRAVRAIAGLHQAYRTGRGDLMTQSLNAFFFAVSESGGRWGIAGVKGEDNQSLRNPKPSIEAQTIEGPKEEYAWSDDYDDGVIDTSLWVFGGGKRGWQQRPPGDGNWNYSHEEVVDPTDGYLKARVWGPRSGNTYGAEAWVRTFYNFKASFKSR